MAGLWFIVGILLLFDIGRLPMRAVNSMRDRKVDSAAVTPAYWRAWGGVLVAAGLVLLYYSRSL